MADQPTSPTPLFGTDDTLRMRRFTITTVVSAFVIAGATALLLHSIGPEGGWAVAAVSAR